MSFIVYFSACFKESFQLLYIAKTSQLNMICCATWEENNRLFICWKAEIARGPPSYLSLSVLPQIQSHEVFNLSFLVKNIPFHSREMFPFSI